MTEKNEIELIEKTCLKDDLSSYDPYDIWTTSLGLSVKKLFNRNKYAALVPAGILTLIDMIFNPIMRSVYLKREYPIVRAQAAMILLNMYQLNADQKYLSGAQKHIDWLLSNSSKRYKGLSWGIGFTWPAGNNLIYSADTPFSTHTPYVLEAIHTYTQKTGDNGYVKYIEEIYRFYKEELKIMYEDVDSIGISYGPMEDRLITNAVAYTLYAYSIFNIYLKEDQPSIQKTIQKLYHFLYKNQREDGSWLYEPFNPNTFIDCFHSCFVIKNLKKTSLLFPLKNCDEIIENGYRYVKQNFVLSSNDLAIRFSKKNKPSIVKFDLYDNAELLNLALLLGDTELVKRMNYAIKNNFWRRSDIFSMIDLIGLKRNKNTLRWATMPYLLTLSKLITK